MFKSILFWVSILSDTQPKHKSDAKNYVSYWPTLKFHIFDPSVPLLKIYPINALRYVHKRYNQKYVLQKKNVSLQYQKTGNKLHVQL